MAFPDVPNEKDLLKPATTEEPPMTPGTEFMWSLYGMMTNGLVGDMEKAMQEARDEMEEAVSGDWDYWSRLSGGLFDDDGTPGVPPMDALDPSYTRHWTRQGRDLNVLGEINARRKEQMAKFDRNQKEAKAKAAKKKAALLKPPKKAPPPRPAAAATAGNEDLYGPVEAKLNYPIGDILKALDALDEKLEKLEDVCADLPTPSNEAKAMFADGYAHMIASFLDERYKRKYGYSRGDHKAAPLTMGGDVPSYFANVKDQTIHRRKVLSMAGLRNLVEFGPKIYAQLREHHFVGDPGQYHGDVGLALMRRVTGNVVDLDTTVLRCSDRATLNAINASNKFKKEAQYANSDEFGGSEQAQLIAKNCALPLLKGFAEMLKLSESAQKTRFIHADQLATPLHVARDNSDRGRHPVWHYINCGQNSFHANVPTMDDVNGALLKAPYHCLKFWLHIHAMYEPGPERQKRVDDFFENCVADSCFNMKWKSIEEFGLQMAHEGSVVDVLQRLQMENQAIFTCDFFDADDELQTNEIKEMQRLADGKVGRDQKGKTRAITPEDVKAWVLDPAIVI